jgi:hypothetical protein
MTLEPSTLNLLLASIIAMQAWIVRELFKLRTRLEIIASHCRACGASYENK